MKKIYKICLSVLMVGLLVSACSGFNKNENGELTASGTITAKSVNVAPEVGGKIAQIFTIEGESVTAGNTLFSIDDEYFQAQLDQADAAVAAAQAAVDTANVQLESAEIQLLLAEQNARQQFGEALSSAWRSSPSSDFDLPAWYFTRGEATASAQAYVDESAADLEKQTDALEKVLADIDNGDFALIEKEIAQAQSAYLAAKAALDAVKRASENKEIKEAAEDTFDLKETELENVQKRYEQALSTEDAANILEARGKVGAAQAQYDAAVDQLLSYYIGDDALLVQAAGTAVELAEKNAAHAEAGLSQAEAAQRTAKIQSEKTTLRAPMTGIVLAQNLEVGELVGAGGIVMTIGNIDEVSLTVYVPEDKYGLVRLGQEVNVQVDSFPEETYTGTVGYISETAEFTPSNVQTVEGRKSTVFAVDITIQNTNHDLKPGMPADVTFILD